MANVKALLFLVQCSHHQHAAAHHLQAKADCFPPIAQQDGDLYSGYDVTEPQQGGFAKGVEFAAPTPFCSDKISSISINKSCSNIHMYICTVRINIRSHTAYSLCSHCTQYF